MNFLKSLFLCLMLGMGCVPVAVAQGTQQTPETTKNWSADVVQWLQGRWKGMGFQTDIESTWTIELNAYMEGGQVLIDYPSIPCGGVWKLKSADDCRAEFVEHITSGKNRCRDLGKLIITYIDANHVSYTYFATDGLTPVLNGYSTLVRTPM